MEELLGSARGMEQLIELISSLGAGEGEAAPAAPTGGELPDLRGLLGMLGGMTGGDRREGGGNALPGGLDPMLLGRMMQLLGRMNEPDSSTRLLQALAPFCGAHRQKRVEEATQMLRLLRLLPLLEGEPREG